MVVNNPLIGPYYNFLWEGGSVGVKSLRFLRFFFGCTSVSFRTFVSFEDLEAEAEEEEEKKLDGFGTRFLN